MKNVLKIVALDLYLEILYDYFLLPQMIYILYRRKWR